MATSRSSPAPLLTNPWASPGGLTTTWPSATSISIRSDLERGKAGLDDEDLGVAVPVEVGSDARRRVDEDHRERHIAMLGADELMRMGAVFELVEPDDMTARLIRGRHRFTVLQCALDTRETVGADHAGRPPSSLADRVSGSATASVDPGSSRSSVPASGWRPRSR